MARLSTLYYYFAVLAILAFLTHSAPVQQQEEAGLPMGLNGLVSPNTPGADPSKVFSEIEAEMAKADSNEPQQAEKTSNHPTPAKNNPKEVASSSATPEASQAPAKSNNPLSSIPVLGGLLSGLGGLGGL
jgi:hypothetical protein